MKIRNKPQFARFLGDAYDLSTFDFRTGKINYPTSRSNKSKFWRCPYSHKCMHVSFIVKSVIQVANFCIEGGSSFSPFWKLSDKRSLSINYEMVWMPWLMFLLEWVCLLRCLDIWDEAVLSMPWTPLSPKSSKRAGNLSFEQLQKVCIRSIAFHRK